MIFREPFIILVIIFWALFPSFLPGQEVTISASETEGCDSLSVDFSYSTTLGNVTSVNWDFGNGTTSAEQNPAPVFYNEPGLYKVRLEINQSYFDEENILVRPSPNSFFAFSDTLEPGSYIVAFRAPPQLVDSFTYQYKWYFPGNTSYNTRWVTHQFDSAGITRVGLVVRDDFGCIDSTFRRIRIIDKIFIPNVFTPNNDGRNDIFIVQTNGRTRYLMQIFSRTGILVYEKEAYYLDWDGTNFSGVKLNTGIYYYTITATDPPGTLSEKGFIHLYR